MAESAVSTLPGGTIVNNLGITKGLTGLLNGIDLGSWGKGGNTGNDYPYMEVWRYVAGGPNFRQAYKPLTTNKNYFETDFTNDYKNACNILGVDLKQLVFIFETVMSNDKDFIYKSFNNNPMNGADNAVIFWGAVGSQFSKIQTNKNTQVNAQSFIIPKSNGFNTGNVLKDIAIGAAGAAAGSLDNELKNNKDYTKIKSDVIDTGAKNALWATLKNYWYVAPILIVIYFIIKKK